MTFAWTPQALYEMHCPRRLNTELMVTAKEDRKALIMTSNRVNGRRVGQEFILSLPMPGSASLFQAGHLHSREFSWQCFKPLKLPWSCHILNFASHYIHSSWSQTIGVENVRGWVEMWQIFLPKSVISSTISKHISDWGASHFKRFLFLSCLLSSR